MVIFDTIIIGGGVSGLAAAIYAGRLNMKTLVIAEKLGGTILYSNDVANYPGFKHISGLEFSEKIKEHALEYNIEIKEEKANSIEKTKDGCFKVFTHNNKYITKTIIFATGTDWKKLDVPGEKEFANKGVHYCALCDGALYKDKIIGIIGGSDSAVKDALLLAEYGKKVYIIYRRKKIRAEPINLKNIRKNKKIEIINNTNVIEVKGDKFLKSVILDRSYKGSKELGLDAIFIDIGRVPLSELAKNIGVSLNEKGEIKVDREGKTNIRGVFASGDIIDSSFKQAITAVAQGVSAVYSVYYYLKK